MTYVFQCRSCKHEFEITATVAEYEARRAPACPECGDPQARRVFTPVLVMTAGGKAGAADEGGCCGGGTCGCRH
ncbi:MAG TPA: FmdB family zinc ribbon protein [bacterium]|nr:FmdB family zinc ribbon protein [bacterium]